MTILTQIIKKINQKKPTVIDDEEDIRLVTELEERRRLREGPRKKNPNRMGIYGKVRRGYHG